jgi:hypothetical protein
LFDDAPFFDMKNAPEIPAAVEAFQEADALLEQDAVLLGAANPVVAEYLFRRETPRKYLLLNRRREEQFKRLVRNEMDEWPLTMPLIEAYVKQNLEKGLNVYLLIFPFEATEGALLDETFKFLKKRFILEDTRYPCILRIRKGSAPGEDGR